MVWVTMIELMDLKLLLADPASQYQPPASIAL